MPHIQNLSDASALERHWGYADRAVPCTNDVGSCEYLDVVYKAHDLGMLYAGIFWATVCGIVFLWAMGRHFFPALRADQELRLAGEKQTPRPPSGIQRLKRAVGAFSRRHLLPEFARPVFGRTSRQQILILVVLAGYLAVWSFVGITYRTWVTPVKNSPGVYNTRTSLGPWSDRVGVLAYALTPLSVLLSTRESLLSLITGVPYHHFNFLHRWLGYIIVIQSSLHTIGWCIIEAKLYQPQPKVGIEWITQLYMIWGVVAMIFVFLLFLLSTPWAIRLTGYEFFRKSHYVLAMLYIGACWGHWSKLSCYLIPSLIVWFIDRGVRLVRTALLHYNYRPDGTMAFGAAQATVNHFPDSVNGDIVRLDFVHPHDAWKIGQHFYLCFPESSIWQSHPFTPLSLPGQDKTGSLHSYIFRAKKGETKKVADIAAKKMAVLGEETAPSSKSKATASVILTGPYGQSTTDHLTHNVNILCVAGGTGIAFVLPVLLGLANQPASPNRKAMLIWAIRRRDDMRWVKQELDQLKRLSKVIDLTMRIFITREAESKPPTPTTEADIKSDMLADEKPISSSGSSTPVDGHPSTSFSVQKIVAPDGLPEHSHPNLSILVNGFVNSVVEGRTTVYASGPGGMISDLRTIVAACNCGSKVWKNDQRFDVDLVFDNRLEW